MRVEGAGLLRYRASVCLMLIVALAGCGASGSHPGAVSSCDTVCATQTSSAYPTASVSAPAQSFCAAVDCAAQHVRVFVEPDAGERPILQAIASARESLCVEVYLLTNSNVVRGLEDAAHRGVDVRVMLEAHPYGGGDVAAARTLEQLRAAGVQAREADPAYHFTHEKALVVDGATAYILTSNLSKSGLGGSSVAANREFGVIDTNAADVAEVMAIFEADWNRTLPEHTDSRLVVSSVNARATLAALIAGATTTLAVQDEEMYDRQSEDALIAAVRRGVEVDVVLPPASSGTSGYASDVARLRQGGVHVRYLSAPYPHAKLVLVDGSLAFIGSENFSSTSLDENRELGLVISDAAAVGTLGATFARDWVVATDAE